MSFPNARPNRAAGRKAIARLSAKRCAAWSEARPTNTPQNLVRYSHTIASIAPVWITISNTFAFSPLKPSRSPARIRWPVEETGKNSVRPSTTPSIKAFAGTTRSTAAPEKRRSGAASGPAPSFSGKGLGLGVDLRALFHEFHRLFLHAFLQGVLLR